MMNETTFMEYPFYERYLVSKQLGKKVNRTILPSPTLSASTDLYTKNIFLPFYRPLTVSNLETLLEHEELHLEYTRVPPFLVEFDDPYIAKKAINLLEDIFINEKIPRKRLESTFRALGGELSYQITLFTHWNDSEKKKNIEKMRGVLFKSKFSTEEIIDKINETINARRIYEDLRKFVKDNTYMVKEFIDLFEPPVIANIENDGSGVIQDRSLPPKEELVKKIRKIFSNWIMTSENIYYKNEFYGKKLNRKWIEDPTIELHPFKNKTIITENKRPSTLVLWDTSGSMMGAPEVLSKSFLVPLLEYTNSLVISQNEYFTNIIRHPSTIVHEVMTGDEGFDFLPDRIKKYGITRKKWDNIIFVTDLTISTEEAVGADYLLNKYFQAPNKWLLCVNKSKIKEHNTRFKGLRRYALVDEVALIKIVKKIVST